MDQGLQGNEKIEQYIELLQKEPSEELLAVTLSAIRRRMNESGQLVVAIDPSIGSQMQVQALQLEDSKKWIPAFTSFDEELKGPTPVMSTFLADIRQLFDIALNDDEIEGVIFNPWNRTIMLDKDLIRLILGKS